LILLVFSIESSHNQPYPPGRVAVRREKPAVNLPQPSATISSQARDFTAGLDFWRKF
jgi:hypothetical protein